MEVVREAMPKKAVQRLAAAGANDRAGMVELADTLVLGASARKGVQVQVLFPAPKSFFANPKPYLTPANGN